MFCADEMTTVPNVAKEDKPLQESPPALAQDHSNALFAAFGPKNSPTPDPARPSSAPPSQSPAAPATAAKAKADAKAEPEKEGKGDDAVLHVSNDALLLAQV
jgi:hypothetical protein